MEIAPISIELWEAFVEERKHWEIVDITGAFVATDRKRFLAGETFNNPMDVEHVIETCSTREQAAYFIGLRSMQSALLTIGILHADA